MPNTLRRDHKTTRKPCQSLLVLVLLWPLAGVSAEITGRVTVQHVGLFAANAVLEMPGGISVSITPLAGQVLPTKPPRAHRVQIHNKTFTPVYMTVQRGDQLQFVSQDPVFHKLFSLSKIQPFTLDLSKAPDSGLPVSSELYPLTETGPWHVFCRIHSMMYFRVDVVDTPYYVMLKDGGEFHFTGLAVGRWQIRVAAIGSEPLLLTTDAITSPPPLQIVLPVKGGDVKSLPASGHLPHSADTLAEAKPESL